MQLYPIPNFNPFKQLLLTLAICLAGVLMVQPGYPQTAVPDQKGNTSEGQVNGYNEDDWVNFGYISVQKAYEVTRNAKKITFKIRNNTTRSISNLYAWIYELSESTTGTSGYRLVNNPNRGGLLVKGGVHSPGKEEPWRFLLTAADAKKKNIRYEMRISHRAVFFAPMEPYLLPKTNEKSESKPAE